MKTAIFKIEGMNCDGCAETIKEFIEKQAGVRRVSVSFAEKHARVLYEPQTIGEERLVETIEKHRFSVVSRETVE